MTEYHDPNNSKQKSTQTIALENNKQEETTGTLLSNHLLTSSTSLLGHRRQQSASSLHSWANLILSKPRVVASQHIALPGDGAYTHSVQPAPALRI